MAIHFIWGSTREVTKKKRFHTKSKGGRSGSNELRLELNIAFCKNVFVGINRNTIWVGEILSRIKKREWRRQLVPYFKLLHSDFISSVENQNKLV